MSNSNNDDNYYKNKYNSESKFFAYTRKETNNTFDDRLALAEYEQVLKTISLENLYKTFDAMTMIVLHNPTKLSQREREIAENGLDLVANELYNRNIKIH